MSQENASGSYKIRAAAAEPVAPRESALPDTESSVDHETDVIVVGGGCAGLASSLFSRWLGEEVVLLEKAPELGGTTIKATFGYWIPNNGPLRDAGGEDPEQDFLRYVARISRPERYDPGSPTFGQSEEEFAQYKAIYDSSWPAAELLHIKGALRYKHVADRLDYWANLDEDKTSVGRVLLPAEINSEQNNGGYVAIQSLSRAASQAGVEIYAGNRVQRLIMVNGAVTGVVATTAAGETLRLGARKAVVFASGGFTHDEELRKNFLALPALGGCAARTNEGDFVRIGTAVGAQLRNMQFAYWCPISLEKAVRKDPDMLGTFLVAGDSMICVNAAGKRCLNEKLPYNEFVQGLYEWDPVESQYPNRVVIQVWDQHTQDNSALDLGGNSVVPEGDDDAHVIRGDTLGALADEISKRLERFSAHTGSLRLTEDFVLSLTATIARWNEMSHNGIDEDFHRGEREIELTVFGGPVAEDPEKKNAVMYPISDIGPYYACLLTGGTVDTKGGPKTNKWAQVLDDQDQPIPGLYGVGNCVASASARAYWAGGGSLGPMIAFAYRAAQMIHEESSRRGTSRQTAAQS